MEDQYWCRGRCSCALSKRNHCAQVVGLEDQEILDMQCGFNHSVVLTADGSVWAFGSAKAAAGARADVQQATRLEGLQNVKAISVGQHHSLAVTGAGEVRITSLHSLSSDNVANDRSGAGVQINMASSPSKPARKTSENLFVLGLDRRWCEPGGITVCSLMVRLH